MPQLSNAAKCFRNDLESLPAKQAPVLPSTTYNNQTVSVNQVLDCSTDLESAALIAQFDGEPPFNLSDVVVAAKIRAKLLGHGKLKRTPFGEDRVRLLCEQCGSTIWISHYNHRRRAFYSYDPSLFVVCGQ